MKITRLASVRDGSLLDKDGLRLVAEMAWQPGPSDKLNAPVELREKIYNDLVLPNVRLLAEFCTNVQIGDET